jgi:ABC-type multidrug transport system fused ATPase/permease subunit
MFLVVLNFSASNFFVLVVFIFIIYFFSKIFKNKIYEYGKKSQNLSAQFYKNINHILGSIKSIKVYRKENIFYKPQTAMRIRWNNNTDSPVPQEEPAGENPPDGAIIDYYLSENEYFEKAKETHKRLHSKCSAESA